MTQALETDRQHDRESFFKYMPANTARLVLENRSLRWSSPVLFNDPFDVPRELSFGLEPRDMVEACAPHMAGLVEHPPDDASQYSTEIQVIIEGVKRGIPNDLRAELLKGLRDVVEELRPSGAPMEEMRELWRSWIPDLRILCLTESPAHVAMWMHYAERYTGAVLELRCVEAQDSPWFAAQPVRYTDAPPALYTTDGWAQILSMEKQRALKTIFDVAAFTKSSDWAYEHEWRITTFKRTTDTGDYTDYKFHVNELGAVYLGPLMTAYAKDELRERVQDYPATRVIEATIGMAREFIFRQTSA
jgi:hypothetical protein